MPYRVKRHVVTQPSDQSYRLIPLTQGRNAIVDTADFEWLSQWNWQAMISKSTRNFYAVRTSNKIGIYMHKVILGLNRRQQGDHKNHNTLDNRRKNLRKCTTSQNLINTRMRSDNSSGFRGVFLSRAGTWYAQIATKNKTKHLGTFPSAEDAAKAYDIVAKIDHGEFAQLNFSS